jgi:hypothetical protein
MSFDFILFISRPLASGFALQATTRQAAPSTVADNIRPIFKSRRRGVAGYYSHCPSGKTKPILFISALFILKNPSRSDANFSPAMQAGA